jgi:phosphoribosylanthranilate isomerase
MTKLKICGMRDTDNILRVAALSPDYMGFIFYDRSPRYVGEQFVIPQEFPAGIKRVGVFVNAPVGEMLTMAARYKLDFIQLHGNESPEVANELKLAGVGTIKVFSVDEHFDFSVVAPYKSKADYFLFDTRGKYYGGNARVFDWSILKGYNQEAPFFLSGGIGPENVAEAKSLQVKNLFAIDVNSGVEASPGIKDPTLIEKLKRQIAH